MRIGAEVRDPALRRTLAKAAGRLGAELVDVPPNVPRSVQGPKLRVVEVGSPNALRALGAERDREGGAVLAVLDGWWDPSADELAAVDDWVAAPVDAAMLEKRIRTALARASRLPDAEQDAAELIRYQELLHDRLTGLPTVPLMLGRARDVLAERGELTILYINFVWYEKIEQIFGWQRLDAVLETTAKTLQDVYAREHGDASRMMLAHTADDDFIVFLDTAGGRSVPPQRIARFSDRLERALRDNVARQHGNDMAALCGIYIGGTVVFRNPKIRIERLIYRGIREAAQAARSAEAWERTRQVADLKAMLQQNAVYMEYHPVVKTDTREIYGYEALARGRIPGLRSPEVLFEVAEEANLLWELSRVLRRLAVQGIADQLDDHQLLFLNVDPTDFDDPTFRTTGPSGLGLDPSRIVLEITERTAIKDYPRFQEYLAAFRAQGFRFAVDDAGSGYAGLGSIANLEPDFIKLDISLISEIDTNFLKQNLVETMVRFAEGHGVQVIAEGVEREAEFETIRKLNVHLAQGFYFHHPFQVAA